MFNRFSFALLALLISLSSAVWAGERGYFGFALSIDGDGKFWNPTLRSVKIDAVSPTSPAALAGLVSGDEILEVAGKPVPGAKGKELKSHVEKDIGQSVQLKLRRANGEVTTVTLVAVAKTW
jgi:C-terminal processing protease CtpA/Prc